MQLVAVSVVKNEADIIEAFVRHTRGWVDHHLVFDHDSSDGTREILGRLVREGLPLSVFTDDALGNLQQARSNHLTRVAAAELTADWILPLDADEFISGPGRPALEGQLKAIDPSAPASVLLLNYHPTDGDDTSQPNPVVRLRYCELKQGPTRKIMVPRALALDPTVAAAKGSHAVHRGSQLIPDTPLSAQFHLAHFPDRSPGQQAARIMQAELQRLGRGRAHAGVDLHYRLGFQTLAENPEMFQAASRRTVDQLRLAPLDYQGGPLRYTATGPEWSRLARALLPYFEKLAVSHGRLLDQNAPSAPEAAHSSPIRRLEPGELVAATFAGREDAFAGFTPQEGWGPTEGPVVDALLPVFHWGMAPASRLSVNSTADRTARMTIEALTYSEGQKVSIELNGARLHEHAFERVQQRERITCRLPLRAGGNTLAMHYSAFLQTPADPRKLAVIYLSLRIA
jgi:hypothetical protein